MDRPEQEPASELADRRVSLGMTVFDDGGTVLGEIRGIDENGFFVTTRSGYESLTGHHVRAGGTFGEAELMWRCTNCGEMGEIGPSLPENCPNCGVQREAIMYWTED